MTYCELSTVIRVHFITGLNVYFDAMMAKYILKSMCKQGIYWGKVLFENHFLKGNLLLKFNVI